MDGSISTSIYLKDSFTGLYNNFQSFSPKLYKRNLVRTLFHRARLLCSPRHYLKEISFIRNILIRNGYPPWYIERHSKPIPEKPISAEKKKFFYEIQYYGKISETIARKVREDIQSKYCHLNAIPIFRTRILAPNSVKDIIPPTQKPMIIIIQIRLFLWSKIHWEE